MRNRRRAALGLIILAAALFVLFHRLLLGEVFFWGLPALQFYPWRDYGFELLRHGELALWNPYNGAGAPLLANYQSALLYPPNWSGLFLPLGWSMSVTAALHLFVGGLGMAALLGRLGASDLGRGVGALAFALTGYLVARLGTYPMIHATTWLPWLVWAAHGLLLGARPRDAGWLALVTGLLLLAGHAQTAWYSLLLTGLYGLWLALSRRLAVGRLLALGLALGLGAGIAALQLVPTAELLSTSQRAEGVDYDFAMNFSFGWARILNFLSPVAFGTPADGSYVERGFYFEYAVYIGIIPLISAFAAVVGWWQRRRMPDGDVFRSVPFWTLIVVAGFVFALGPNSPIFPFLYRHMPTFDLFQAPARWQLWTVFALCVLSGIGVSAWGRSYRAKRWARRALAACLSLLLLSGAALLLAPPVQGAQILLRATLAAALLGVVAAWLTLRQPPPDSPRLARWSLLVLLVIAADLIWAGWGQNPTVPAAFYEAERGAGQPRGYWPSGAEETIKFETFFRVDDYRAAAADWRVVRASNLPNLNLIDRRSLLNNFDPLLAGHYAAFMRALDDAAPDARAGFYAVSAVGAVYAPDGTSGPSGVAPARAWLVDSVCWHPSDADLYAALSEAGAAVARQAQIPGDGPCPPVPLNGVNGDILIGDQGNRVELQVRSPIDGWLVLADTDYPGWTARIDGEPAPIFRANGTFRAVQVPPGEHMIVFAYEPPWLVPAVAASIISLIVTAGLLLAKSTRLFPASWRTINSQTLAQSGHV